MLIKKIIAIVISLLYITSPAVAQTAPLKIMHLAGNCYIFETYNTYKNNRVSANGLYLVTEKGVVMIDTPWDTKQLEPLLDSIRQKHGKEVVLCIATHSHADRTAGLEDLKKKGVKTYTSKQTDAICREQKSKRAEFCFTNDTIFRVGSYSVETFYGGTGHTEDNIVIWFGADKVLYGGCLVKSADAKDLGYIGEANLTAWPATLANVKRKFPNPKFIIPGHGDWMNIGSIDHTLDLLKKK